ncbi:hypothetical protein GCM10012289_54800 [Nonomuraea cavernae]|uniref:Secreted protein n=1 Tax=Nonomuraea cavernae TaxID=2045107 RepID=A0A917Z6W1_9ACTN|nr:hypothetical protein GCM10012289_54800 [Nonomuraea cavernae]
MVPTDSSPFVLRRATSTLGEGAAKLAKELGRVTVETVLARGNRTAVRKGGAAALGKMQPRPADWYAFDSADQNTADWYPQGLTCGEDSGTAKVPVFVVSWYFKPRPPVPERGIRVTFLSPSTLKYQHALLVEARPDGSYQAIDIHAGGVAWYGDLLYVADTTRGLRVFDVRNLLDLRTAQDDLGDPRRVGRANERFHAFGYRYVIPQTDSWRVAQPGPRFSFVSIDRGTTPHALISGEYAVAGPNGRVARWDLPLDGGTPRDAHVMGHPKIQGAVSNRGRWYLSQAVDAATNGRLQVYSAGKLLTRQFPIGPEDLTVRGAKVWSVTEFRNKRVIFGVDL